MSHSQPDVIYSIVQSSLDRGTQITQMEAKEAGLGLRATCVCRQMCAPKWIRALLGCFDRLRACADQIVMCTCMSCVRACSITCKMKELHDAGHSRSMNHKVVFFTERSRESPAELYGFPPFP